MNQEGVEEIISRDVVCVTTGFGKFNDVTISTEDCTAAEYYHEPFLWGGASPAGSGPGDAPRATLWLRLPG